MTTLNEWHGGVRHPFSGAMYETDGAGHVRVTTADGSTGVFTPDGRWLGGDVRDCNPHLCIWVSAHRPANHHRLSAVHNDRAK